MECNKSKQVWQLKVKNKGVQLLNSCDTSKCWQKSHTYFKFISVQTGILKSNKVHLSSNVYFRFLGTARINHFQSILLWQLMSITWLSCHATKQWQNSVSVCCQENYIHINQAVYWRVTVKVKPITLCCCYCCPKNKVISITVLKLLCQLIVVFTEDSKPGLPDSDGDDRQHVRFCILATGYLLPLWHHKDFPTCDRAFQICSELKWKKKTLSQALPLFHSAVSR